MQQPVFSLLDGEASAAFDVALTQAGCSGATPTPTPAFTSAPRLAQAKLQRMLRADAAMPVRGLGVDAFTECLLALQEAPKPRRAYFGEDDDAEGGGAGGAERGAGDGAGDSGRGDVGGEGGGGGDGQGVATPPDRAQSARGVRAGLLASPEAAGGSGWWERLAGGCARCWAGQFRLRRRTRRLLRSAWADRLMDVVVVADAAVLLVEVELLARRSGGHLQALEWPAALGFDAVYASELGLKLWCFGTLPYVKTLQYGYAGATTVLSLGADVSLAAARHLDQASEHMQHVVMCLRALRMLRLLASVLVCRDWGSNRGPAVERLLLCNVRVRAHVGAALQCDLPPVRAAAARLLRALWRALGAFFALRAAGRRHFWWPHPH